MTPQELKNSILQLAIQGKLVEQRPEEGTAAEQLEKIVRHRTNKTTRTHGTKSRAAHRASSVPSVSSVLSVPVVLPIPDDEKPFDIPESWEWVRLGEVCEILDSKRRPITKSERTSGPYPYYGASCVQDYVADYIFDEPLVLLGEDGAKWGRGDNSAFRISGKAWVNNHAHVLRPLPEIDHAYLVHTLCILDLRIFVTGTTVPKLNQARMCQILLPLPPLAEQKRIVAKIEELLPLIDRYEKAWSKLEDFNKRFPVDMQKSVLQMAIQGKLVEQRPEEGTGEELLEKILAAKNAKGAKKNLTRGRGARGEKATSALSASPREEISDDEKPFDIPESWEWVRLGDIGAIVTGATPNKSESDLYGGQYPFYKPAELDQGYNVIHAKETLSDVGWRKARRLSVGSVLVTCIGATIGKTGIIRREGTCNQQINAIIPCEVVSEYLYYVIISAWFQTSLKAEASRTTLPIMNKSKFENLMIPLPPLAEQKRIVAKLEELLQLCERLKSPSGGPAGGEGVKR